MCYRIFKTFSVATCGHELEIGLGLGLGWAAPAAGFCQALAVKAEGAAWEDHRISWGPSWREGAHSSDVHSCPWAWNPFPAQLPKNYFRSCRVGRSP